METPNLPAIRALRPTGNKGRIVGQKRTLQPKHVWAIRVRLELAEKYRDLALFNMAIDSKLSGCDLVRMGFIFSGDSETQNTKLPGLWFESFVLRPKCNGQCSASGFKL